MEIYLYRHGQTIGNSLTHFVGSTDQPLSEKGIQQLEELPKHPEINMIYTSTKKRAIQTCEILFPNAQIVQMADFDEMDFGEYEDVDLDILEKRPEYLEWVYGDFDVVTPGGESINIFMKRALGAFEELVDESIQNGVKEINMVAHGGLTMALRTQYVYPRGNHFIWWTVCKNGGYWHFHLDEKTWKDKKELKIIEIPEFMKPDDPDTQKILKLLADIMAQNS